VELIGTNYLQLREVEAFDRNGVNVALNKPATQSSTFQQNPASKAVDGNKTIAFEYSMSITNSQPGKYHLSVTILMHISFKTLSISFLFVKEPGGKSIWWWLWRL
jgi:hypothetical protein